MPSRSYFIIRSIRSNHSITNSSNRYCRNNGEDIERSSNHETTVTQTHDLSINNRLPLSIENRRVPTSSDINTDEDESHSSPRTVTNDRVPSATILTDSTLETPAVPCEKPTTSSIRKKCLGVLRHLTRVICIDLLPWLLGSFVLFYTFKNGGLTLGFSFFVLLISLQGVLKWWSTRPTKTDTKNKTEVRNEGNYS